MPIIVLSARDTESAKVDALDAGADDCSRGSARHCAALRRATPDHTAPVVETDMFTVDLAARRVTRDGVDVRLTPTEWHFLDILARNPGKVIDHHRLLTEIWGPAYLDQANYLRVYIAQLRRKLEQQPSRPRHLLTEPGFGYRLAP